MGSTLSARQRTAAGGIVLAAGTRIGFAEIAAAAKWRGESSGLRGTGIAVLSTGDELVTLRPRPVRFIRNTQLRFFGAQISLLGGEAVIGMQRSLETAR